MKGRPRPPFYFSAYRLKTLEEAASNSSSGSVSHASPYLKAILSGKTRKRNNSRVFPMINPYKEKMAITGNNETTN
jgi:hypothetical protein